MYVSSSLSEFALEHRKFIVAMGWDYSKSPLESVALICEEIGELTHELRQPIVDKEKAGQEIADIILRAIDLAYEMDIDPSAAVFKKIINNFDNIEKHKAKGRVI
tara:strand:+ start:133 stop:447 length:315 start_codon:yes stop_codon:yes gene_type:complete